MAKDRILAISTWGFPPQWSKYRYRVSIEHKRFQQPDLPKDFECESCCTTLVLTSYLSRSFDVDLLIFGVDTVVDPSKAGNSVRDEAEKLYREWFQELVRTCCCCSDIDWQKVSEISILPGVGHYHGWHFKASIDNLFVKAFYKIYNKMNNKDYNWVFLDLTHGLNYIVVTILYAAIANTIILDKERNLIIVNSEPATGSDIKCIPQQQPRQVIRSTLTILDVTRLQKVISFIRSAIALKYLQPYPFGGILDELKGFDPDVGENLEKYVLPFFKLLSNGIVGPTFNGSYVVNDQGVEEPSPYALCRDRDHIFSKIGTSVDDCEFKPTKVDQESKAVEYSKANIFSVLLLALEKIVDDVCRHLTASKGDRYLKKYLDNAAEYYKRLHSVAYELIVDETKNELDKVTEIVAIYNRDLKQFESVKEVERDKIVQIDGKLYPVLATIRREDMRNINIDDIKSMVSKKEKELAEDREKIKRSPRRYLRHMCAHAGLEYAVIERMVIDIVNKDIVKVVYIKQLLDALLKHGV